MIFFLRILRFMISHKKRFHLRFFEMSSTTYKLNTLNEHIFEKNTIITNDKLPKPKIHDSPLECQRKSTNNINNTLMLRNNYRYAIISKVSLAYNDIPSIFSKLQCDDTH